VSSSRLRCQNARLIVLLALLVSPLLVASDPLLPNTENGRRWAELLKSPKKLGALFHEFYNAAVAVKPIEGFKSEAVTRSVWAESIAMTERHNEPGEFTAFIGWEWTSSPGRTTMHRVIFTPAGADIAGIGSRKGVPMGGDLTLAPKGKVLGFLVLAANASYSNTIGDAELATAWKDSEFEPGQSAFYYARVLEIPTPRHSLFDAVALNTEHPEVYPDSIQERAYTSPIWYTP